MAHARKDLRKIGTEAKESGARAERAFEKVGKQARKTGTDAKEAGDDTGKSWDKAGEKADEAGEKIKGTGRKTKQTGDETAGLGAKAGKASSILGRLGPVGAAAMGVLAVGVGVAAVAVGRLRDALAAAMERGRSAAQAGASIGMDPAQVRQLGQRAGRLYAQGFGESADEAVAGIAAVTSSIDGLAAKSGPAIDAAAKKALTFANVFRVDVADAAKFAGTLLSVGLADDADHAFDLITRASTKVPVALRGDIMDAGEEYGHFFRSLGFNGEQAFGILVDAAGKSKFGIDKAGDAIAEFTKLATEMNTSTTDAYSAIGLDAEKMASDLLTGGDKAQTAFRKIVTGILAVKDPVERAQLAMDLFGTPLEDLNKNDIPEFLRGLLATGDGLDGVAGATDRAGEALKAYPLSIMDRLKRGWETLQANVGEKLAPAVEKALGWLEKIGKSEDFQRFLSETGALIRKVADDALPKLKEQWNNVVKAFEDNRAEIELVGKMLAWIFSEWMVASIKGLFRQLEYGAKIVGAVGRAFKTMARGALDSLGWIVSGAARAFGWMPGIGPKLRKAEKEFNIFRRRVNNALAGIRDRTVRVNVGVTGAGARYVLNDPARAQVQFGGGHQAYAHGGITSGGLAMVGERGRELVELPVGSKVNPAGTTRAMMEGGVGGGGRLRIEIAPAPGLAGASRDLVEAIIGQLAYRVRTQGGGSTDAYLDRVVGA